MAPSSHPGTARPCARSARSPSLDLGGGDVVVFGEGRIAGAAKVCAMEDEPFVGPVEPSKAGLKEAVVPAGRLEADRFTVSVSPPIAVVATVVVAWLPGATDPDAGLAEMVKSVVETTVE